jgi:two-component system OmpR family sensor kinase
MSAISDDGHAWWHSLYWRAGAIFVLVVTGVVAVQAGASYWLFSRDIDDRARRVNTTLSAAEHLSAELETHPDLDLAAYLRTADPAQRIFVVMRDGRVAGSRLPTPDLIAGVLKELRSSTRTEIPALWRRSDYTAAPVIVQGRLVGAMGSVRPSILEQNFLFIALLGPLALVGGALLTALLMFGPTRRRLRDLERAAHRLETGDLSARASEDGRDEVSQLARAFNSMAAGLARHSGEQEAMTRARRQLLADVSHELMTPLTAIRGYLETLAMARVDSDEPTRKSQVAVARRETNRLERLVGDLLDIARFEAGGGTLDLTEVKIEELLEQVVEHHEHECQLRNIQLITFVSQDARTVVADAFRLEQALINVTTNALRHSPDGGRVVVEVNLQGDSVAISVTDAGDGIPPEHVPLIFDRFHKVSSGRANASGGSGLGLSIVRAIVERHGGTVRAHSVLGAGTTVTMLFPMRRPMSLPA